MIIVVGVMVMVRHRLVVNNGGDVVREGSTVT